MSESSAPMNSGEEQQPQDLGAQRDQIMDKLIADAMRLFPYMKGDSLEARFDSLIEVLPGSGDPELQAKLRARLLPEDPGEVLIRAFFSPRNDFIDTARRLSATVKFDPRKDKVEIILPEYSTGHEDHHHAHHHQPRVHRLVRKVKRSA